MKVRVVYTTEVNDDYRRALRMVYGKPGLATRDEVKDWLYLYGQAKDEDLMELFEEQTKHEPEPEGVCL